MFKVVLFLLINVKLLGRSIFQLKVDVFRDQFNLGSTLTQKGELPTRHCADAQSNSTHFD